LGHALSLPFRAVNSTVERLAVSRLFKRDYFQSPLDPYYAGYLVFNWLALFTASLLFLRLPLGLSGFSMGSLVTATLLVINGVTRWFFWTPHLQILNVLVPMISIGVCVGLRSRPPRERPRYFITTGFFSGLGSLVYGASILIVASATVAIVVAEWRSKRPILAAVVASGWIAFAIPPLIWREYVVSRTGSFYMHETAQYHQFVWIAESARLGFPTLITDVANNLARFGKTLWPVLAPLVALLGMLFLAFPKARTIENDPQTRNVEMAVGAFVLVAVPFFSLMGFYAARLSWELAPPVAVLISMQLNRILESATPRRRGVMAPIIVLACVAYAFYVLRSDQSGFLATG
jgi:hypothetical protein